MRADDALASLYARFSNNRTRQITVSADEVAEWPGGLFQRLLSEKLLTPTEPAQSLECRGCEQACLMPVSIVTAESTHPARAFIACDKPENFGRIPVAFSRLHQWQLTRADFKRLQRAWIVSSADTCNASLKKIKAPVPFRSSLGALLTEIERRAAAQGLPFDRNAMPGRKVDFQAVADKFDAALEHTARTFDDYLDGLCAFKRGARESDFYAKLFPEYFK